MEPLDWVAIRQKYGVDPKARPDKQGILRAYVESDLSLERIGEAFEVSSTSVRRFALKAGCVRKVGTKPLGWSKRPKGPGGPKPKRSSPLQRRREFLRRMMSVVDKRLRVLERRMTQALEPDGSPQSAMEIEKDIRGLADLARIYAKLVELDEAMRETSEAEKASEVIEDADELRRDLARRIAGFSRTGDTG
jgi:hypothetical protein